MQVEFVLGVALHKGFFSGFSTKINIFKFQFHQERGSTWKPAKIDVAYPLKILFIFFSLPVYMNDKLLEVCGTFSETEIPIHVVVV